MKQLLRSVGRIAVLSFAVAPFFVFAGEERPPGLTSLDDVEEKLDLIANWMYTFALIVGVIMFLWGAFLYFTASDDPEKLKKAKSTLIFGVIGLVIAMLASGVPEVIKALLGVG